MSDLVERILDRSVDISFCFNLCFDHEHVPWLFYYDRREM